MPASMTIQERISYKELRRRANLGDTMIKTGRKNQRMAWSAGQPFLHHLLTARRLEIVGLTMEIEGLLLKRRTYGVAKSQGIPPRRLMNTSARSGRLK